MKALNFSEKEYQKVEGDPHLRDDLSLDSLEEAEIVMSVEEMHGLDEIPEDYARKAEKISHIESYVLENCKEDLEKIVDLKDKGHFAEILLKNITKEFALTDESLSACASVTDIIETIVKAADK